MEICLQILHHDIKPGMFNQPHILASGLFFPTIHVRFVKKHTLYNKGDV